MQFIWYTSNYNILSISTKLSILVIMFYFVDICFSCRYIIHVEMNMNRWVGCFAEKKFCAKREDFNASRKKIRTNEMCPPPPPPRDVRSSRLVGRFVQMLQKQLCVHVLSLPCKVPQIFCGPEQCILINILFKLLKYRNHK